MLEVGKIEDMIKNVSHIGNMSEIIEKIIETKNHDQTSNFEKYVKEVAKDISSETNKLIEQLNIRSRQNEKDIDIFLSAPMAGCISDDKYKAMQTFSMKLQSFLQEECNFKKVSYAGANIDKIEEFEPANLSMIKTLKKLRRSKYFIMIYPEKIASSILVEIGCAIAFELPIVIFTKKRAELPFLLLDPVDMPSPILIFDYTLETEIFNIIRKNKRELFAT